MVITILADESNFVLTKEECRDLALSMKQQQFDEIDRMLHSPIY